MADQPELMWCGPVMSDTVKLSHNGSCWVIDLEALETLS